MRVVFADTFYWAALTSSQDASHESAIAFGRTLGPTVSIVTTQEVLVEYLNYFSGWGTHFRRKATEVVEGIRQNPFVHVAPQTSDSFLAGLALYRDRSDKAYSLTDCISMVTMLREGLSDALTDDHHFVQEGFRAVFRGDQ